MPRPASALLPPLLASLVLSACTDGDAEFFPGRVPCASTMSWDDGASSQRRFTYDPGKHLLVAETLDDAGLRTAITTNTWDGDHLVASARTSARIDTRTTYTWVDDRLTTMVRDDLMLDDGDDGFTITNTYQDGVQTAQRWTYHAPDRGGTLTTVTGDDTTRATWRECPEPADGRPCTVYVYEQPDRDPDHWTRGTGDDGEDGVIDLEFVRTLDRHFLDLTFEWAEFVDGARQVQSRDTSRREADGTELSRQFEMFSGGAPIATLVETFAFACPTARTAPTSDRTTARDLPERPRAAWRRGPVDGR